MMHSSSNMLVMASTGDAADADCVAKVDCVGGGGCGVCGCSGLAKFAGSRAAWRAFDELMLGRARESISLLLILSKASSP